jgi:hypothetical protein
MAACASALAVATWASALAVATWASALAVAASPSALAAATWERSTSASPPFFAARQHTKARLRATARRGAVLGSNLPGAAARRTASIWARTEVKHLEA